MYFGFSEYAGVPWETLIKIFRAENGNKKYSKVELVWKDFKAFLSNPHFVTENESRLSLFYFVAYITGRLRKKITRRSTKVTDIVELIHEEIDIYNQLGDLENIGVGSFEKFREKYGTTISEFPKTTVRIWDKCFKDGSASG